MKLPRSLLLVCLLVGCGTGAGSRSAAFGGDYELRDTARYDGALAPGQYAVLLRNGVVLDSVDLYFGVHLLNDGRLVFLPVEVLHDSSPDWMDVTRHVAHDGRRRTALGSFLPNFSDHFSSPTVVDGVLYYWGLEKLETWRYAVHAVRYDALRREIRSCYLFATELRTDDRGYFAPPAPADGGMVYETPRASTLVDSELARRPDPVHSCAGPRRT